MKFSSASLLVLSTVGVNGQFFGSNSTNSTGFQGSIQPVGAVTQPPVVTPLTDSPSEEPTITPEPTDAPTPTPSVSNQDVCDDIDSDWEEWYQDITDADHTCQCQAVVEGLPEDRVRMACFGEELFCCAATGICYMTDDASEHIIAERLDDGVVDLSVWRSCTNVYQGGVDNPVQTHRICHEFAYAPQTAVARQESGDPALAGCRVTINDQECNSCTPCEENGAGMTGYDCTNIEGIDQIPTDSLPSGPQTECHIHDFPECTFNGGFVDVDKSVLTNSGTAPLAWKASIGVLLAGAVLVWN